MFQPPRPVRNGLTQFWQGVVSPRLQVVVEQRRQRPFGVVGRGGRLKICAQALQGSRAVRCACCICFCFSRCNTPSVGGFGVYVALCLIRSYLTSLTACSHSSVNLLAFGNEASIRLNFYSRRSVCGLPDGPVYSERRPLHAPNCCGEELDPRLNARSSISTGPPVSTFTPL